MTGVDEDAGCAVWLILRSRCSDHQVAVERDLLQWASDRSGVRLRVLHAEERRLTQDGDGRRPIEILQPVDAHELYQSLHLVRTCVLGQGGIYILKNPRKAPSSQRDCIRLPEFVCHKASYDVVEEGRSPSQSAESRLSVATSDCSELRDPRLIPLHVFDGDLVPSELLDEVGRERFRRMHRNTGGGWASPSAGTWHQADPRAWHGAAGPGRKALRVGDFVLPVGFHWDVGGQGRRITVVNSLEEWELGPRDYVNVYPDATIRAGSRARKRWSAEK